MSEEHKEALRVALDAAVPPGSSVVVVLVSADLSADVIIGSNEPAPGNLERAEEVAATVQRWGAGARSVDAAQLGWLLAAADRMAWHVRGMDLDGAKAWGTELERRVAALGFEPLAVTTSLGRNVQAVMRVVPAPS